MLKEEKEKKATSLIEAEVTNWELGEVNITDKISFLMKNVVKNARKNYFGIFDQQNDPITGKPKVFIPLTETLVENVVKNIDIDTADIKVKAKNQSAYGVAAVFRYVLFNYLDNLRFGKLLNNIIRLTALDGTCFVKSWKDGKELKSRIVDRLNMIVDPSANDLTQTPVIERNILSLPEFQAEAKSGKWENADKVEGETVIDRSGFALENDRTNSTEVPMVTVYERYGWMPKSIITGNEKDEEYVYGMIIASGITEGESIFHKAKEVDKCPYVIFKFKDIWNRLDGRGVAEMIINLQAYVNEIVNTRINKHRITQMGLWKIRGGITPQQFGKMFTTHAIKMKSARDDIELMQTTDADQSTYQDEQVGKGWAQDVVGTFDEKQITASTPATNALIQERGTAIRSNLVQENLGFAIEELIEDHYIPIIKKILRPGDVVRITGNPADLERMQEKLIKNEVARSANEYLAQGGLILPGELEMEEMRITEELSQMGEDRFVEITDNAFDTEFDINITIGDEELNPALVAQSITQALGIAAQFPGSRLNVDEALREIFDALGLDGDRLIQAQEELGVAEAELAQAEQAPEMGGTGQGTNEANLNPTPVSRPVV